MNLTQNIINRAKNACKTIVFPEADFSDRIVVAGKKIANDGIAKVVFVGNKQSLLNKLGSNCDGITVYDPNNFQQIDKFAECIYQKRKHKGLSMDQAKVLAKDPIYFAVMLVETGMADGMVCGAEVSTAKTLKPALQIIKSKTGIVSSYFLFTGKNNVTDDAFLMGDCAVVECPTAEEEATIASLMLTQNRLLGLNQPRVAFLSYSTMGSAKSESVEKVQKAYQIFAKQNPNVCAVGEAQFDASVFKRVADVKMPNANFVFPANIFVMPNIDAGNIGYKMVQYFGNLNAIGPITMGFNKPVNDLSRGCTVQDIILLTAITAIQATENN